MASIEYKYSIEHRGTLDTREIRPPKRGVTRTSSDGGLIGWVPEFAVCLKMELLWPGSCFLIWTRD